MTVLLPQHDTFIWKRFTKPLGHHTVRGRDTLEKKVVSLENFCVQFLFAKITHTQISNCFRNTSLHLLTLFLVRRRQGERERERGGEEEKEKEKERVKLEDLKGNHNKRMLMI